MRPAGVARGLLLALAGALACPACGDNLTASSVPPTCRDAAWSDQYLAAADGGVTVNDAGQVVLPVAPADLDVTLDPYGLAPLAALATVHGVRPECVTTVRVVVAGLDGEDLDVTLPFDDGYARRYADPDRLHGSATAVQVPVLGLYPDHANQVRIEVAEAGALHTASFAVVTAPLTDWLPTVEIATADRGAMEPGWNLAGFLAGEGDFRARPFVYDHHGRIRWVLLVAEAVGPGFVTPLMPLRDGNLLFGVGGAVYEYSLLGREVQRFVLPDAFQQDHDVEEMPDGNLLVCGKSRDAFILNDVGTRLSPSDQVLEIDRVSGAVRNVWDLRQFLDVTRYTYFKTGVGQDWLHLNSAVYDPSDDSVVVSGKHQGVAKITRGGAHPDDPYAGKELRWILAPHRGWGQAGWDGSGMDLGPYLLTGLDGAGAPVADAVQDGGSSTPEFGWPFGQHAVMLTGDGDLFMFDNGDGRDLWTYPGEPFSRGVVYHVDAAPSGVGGTVRQVWQYGRERGADLFAPVLSNVDVGTVTGNRFVMPGSYTTQSDGTPGGVAKMVEVRMEDGAVVFEAHIVMRGTRPWGDDMCYRQKRMPLYFGAPGAF